MEAVQPQPAPGASPRMGAREYSIDCLVLGDDSAPVALARVETMGRVSMMARTGGDGRALLTFAGPASGVRIQLVATAGSRLGVGWVELGPAAPRASCEIVVLALKWDALLAYGLTKLLRLLLVLKSPRLLGGLLLAALVLTWVGAEFGVGVPIPLREFWRSRSLHLIRHQLNAAYATEELPAVVKSGQTVTLTARTPEKIVLHRVTIEPGGKLKIVAGVTLRFAADAEIRCHGSLVAEGTERAPIVFTALDPNRGWRHVAILDAQKEELRFEHCRFRDGRGASYNAPNASTAHDQESFVAAESAFRAEPGHERIGGALLVNNSKGVVLNHCWFERNESSAGGAMYLRNGSEVRLEHCVFEDNVATSATRNSAPGGAIILLTSQISVHSSRFLHNRAVARYSCGGALYVGLESSATIKGSEFVRNAAANAGGAIYALNLKLPFRDARHRSTQIDTSRFVGNQARSGSAVFADMGVGATILDCEFVGNKSGPLQGPLEVAATGTAGHGGTVVIHSDKAANTALLSIDASSYRSQRNAVVAADEAPAGVWQDVKEVGGYTSANLDDHRAIVTGSPLRILLTPIEQQPVPFSVPSFRVASEPRRIDTVVLHYTSATGWFKPTFHDQFAFGLADLERSLGLTPANLAQHRYDWRLNVAIFRAYGVSAHYLIGRDGDVRQLVADRNIAFHAGESRMPSPDGRANVNDFSLGIELIASEAATAEAAGAENGPMYTEAQYASLRALLGVLCRTYPITSIVGHDEIASGRKRDPGSQFQWSRVRQPDRTPLAEFTATQ